MSLGAWLVTAVVIAWFLFTREGRLTLAALLSAAILVGLVAGLQGCARSGAEYDCAFDRIQGKYQVSEAELRKRGQLILVTRDGREFAFPRSQLRVCERAE
jgi:hypothetical protein